MKVILLVLFITNFSMAVDMQLSRSITARKNVSGVLKPIGYLAPDTIVKIVDANKDAELSNLESENQVLSWLKNRGELRYYQGKTQLRKDYFYPVEILQNKNSVGVNVGDIVFVSLRYLAKREGLKMVVTSDTAIISKTSKSQFYDFKKSIEPLLAKVDKKAKKNLRNRGVAGKGILKKCPVAFKDFLVEIKRVSSEKRIPAAILLSVLQVESSGSCFSRRREYNGSFSVGLFQVNTKSTSIAPCTSGQLAVLKGNPTKDDLESIRCLDNPLTNLEVAGSILREKYARVNTQKQPTRAQWWHMNEQEKNSWRKSLAAYNGGQAYVFQAFRDMRSFNKKSGLNLDPDKWEHRRVFFMRRWLARGKQRDYFGNRQRFRRGLYDTVLNLAYVETIAGRSNGDTGLADRWQKVLAAGEVDVAAISF